MRAWGPRAAVVVALACAHGGPGRPAAAGHAGALQLSLAPAGPYAVSVWTQPTPPRVGASLITVAVMRPGENTPVPGARVHVTAVSPGGAAPAPLTGTMRSVEEDPLGVRHRAELRLPRAGAWRVTVAVAGPDGAGTASFDLLVARSSAGARVAVWSGAGAAVVTAMWFWHRRRPRAVSA